MCSLPTSPTWGSRRFTKNFCPLSGYFHWIWAGFSPRPVWPRALGSTRNCCESIYRGELFKLCDTPKFSNFGSTSERNSIVYKSWLCPRHLRPPVADSRDTNTCRGTLGVDPMRTGRERTLHAPHSEMCVDEVFIDSQMSKTVHTLRT